MRQVSVFGNPDLPADAMPVSLLPELRKRFPDIEFIHQDPNEDCTPPESPWIIIDTVKGIPGVRLITDADLIQVKKRLTLHDYDLGMHLTLLKKIYPKLQLRIIGIPLGSSREEVLPEVVRLLSAALREELS
ncbi:MAG: hypothetical protein AAB490_00155 [Patescibacteria group bacterium]